MVLAQPGVEVDQPVVPRPATHPLRGPVLAAFAIHTIALAARIYISGRPPVTNLYSSAVFIAWGIVVFSAALQAIYRNGLGLLKQLLEAADTECDGHRVVYLTGVS